MTKYSYACEQDKRLINKSIDNMALLVFGTKNKNMAKEFMKLFETKVKEINVFKEGTTTKYINHKTPGICRLDNDNKLIIDMLGYEYATESQYDFIKHEGTHEICHAFADLLPLIYSQNSKGEIVSGVMCQNHMGMIKETNPVDGHFVGNHFYGKMFNETMMDITTSIAINSFDSHTNVIDEVLKNNYLTWGNAKTGYSIFTSITRLAIAAFSNVANINYANIIKNGSGIFNPITTMNNGKTYKANDFMYGIMFDQLHIQKAYDCFMGEGQYRSLCHFIDKMFIKYHETNEIRSNDVKMVMNILADFLNKKCHYYINNNIMSKENANLLMSNFNSIWNEMQYEYSAYFKEEEINDIKRRAGK